MKINNGKIIFTVSARWILTMICWVCFVGKKTQYGKIDSRQALVLSKIAIGDF